MRARFVRIVGKRGGAWPQNDKIVHLARRKDKQKMGALVSSPVPLPLPIIEFGFAITMILLQRTSVAAREKGEKQNALCLDD